MLPDSPLTPLTRSFTRFDASARVEREEASLGGDVPDGGDTAVRSYGRHAESDSGGWGMRVPARARGGQSRSRDDLHVIYRRHQGARREGNAVASPIAGSGPGSLDARN